MAWGTDFTVDIFLNKQIFTTKYQVVDEIKEIELEISNIKQKIGMLVSATPNTIVPIDSEITPFEWLNLTFNELFDEFNELTIKLFKLGLYQEYLDENKIINIGKQKE